jgi:hypothetical protein
MKLSKLIIRETDDSNGVQVSNADGLTSGYQRTNVTSSGALVAETAGGNILTELFIPWFEIFPYNDIVNNPSVKSIHTFDELAEGYKAMALENDLLAEELLPIALETWPNQEG